MNDRPATPIHTMHPDRRQFLRQLGWLGAAGAGLEASCSSASAAEHSVAAHPNANGVLVDLTMCVGCRLCEHACKKANGFEAGPVEAYDDQSVFKQRRRPGPDSFTVVNAFDNPRDPGKPVYAKINCMHCVHPACASACIVGALRKQPEHGAVTYEVWKCIGCRYCMVACPFQIPAYSYDDAFTPEVLKCQFCYHRTREEGGLPGCVEACPRQTLTYGKRSELIELAHEKIRKQPDRYIDHVYGEHEVGGTSWLYLSPIPFEQAGFVKLGPDAPPALTEKIQHGVFSPKLGVPPLLLYGMLGAAMWYFNPHRKPVRSRETSREAAIEPAHGLSLPSGAMALAPAMGGSLQAPPGLVVHEPAGVGHRHDRVHAEHDVHEHEHHEPRPVNCTLRTPGVYAMLGLIGVGLAFGLYRFIFGIGASTNLNQQYPWGLWIGIDVASGVALAAGGFTSAFLTHILWREHYHAIARPALLTAMLGYTFVVLGLQADLGRYYNVWHPMLPMCWQGNSVLFEVGMCVMAYLNVLYLEFAPIACERLMVEERRFPRLSRWAGFINAKLQRIMFLLVIAGCTLSCLHQSSLGNLMVIAPSKLHPLWWTPISPLLFLLSAIMVGFPMVIWESLFASWALKLKPEMNILGPLARFIPFTAGVYLIAKIADVVYRGAYVHLADGSLQSISWLVEIGGCVLLPLVMMAIPAVRRSPRLLFTAATLIVLGIILNRVNVFIIGYKPPYADGPYIPSIGEFAVTIGLIAALMLTYRIIVTFLPVISQPKVRPAA